MTDTIDVNKIIKKIEKETGTQLNEKGTQAIEGLSMILNALWSKEQKEESK